MMSFPVSARVVDLGVSTNIHWFSDFVADALTGYAIGTVQREDGLRS